MLNLFSRPLIAALVLFGVASCGGDVIGVATEASGLGAGCTLYRPIFWNGPNTCREAASSHLQMADGDYFSNTGYGAFYQGYGEYGVSCHDGVLTMEYSYCNYGIEP